MSANIDDMIHFPEDGGTAVDLKGIDAFAVVAEPASEVWRRMRTALAQSPEAPWFELTILANPDDDRPRRWTAMDAREVNCLTYLSAEHVEQLETEIE